MTVNITSITVPNSLANHLAVVNAAKEMLQGFFTRYWQLQQLMLSSRLAYHFDTCEGLRWNRLTCDIDERPDYVLFVDLGTHHIHVALADVLNDTVSIKDRVLHSRSPQGLILKRRTNQARQILIDH
jgi:hypothetical protein